MSGEAYGSCVTGTHVQCRERYEQQGHECPEQLEGAHCTLHPICAVLLRDGAIKIADGGMVSVDQQLH
jgi:hypothetical protein